MKKPKILILLMLMISVTTFSQEIFIKECWGKVLVTTKGETKSVKKYEVYNDKLTVFNFVDNDSKLWVRIGDDLQIIKYSATKSKFSVNELLNPEKSYFFHEEDDFMDKVFSFYSSHESDETPKVSNLMLSPYGGVNRGDNDKDRINFGTLQIMEGMPFLLDWGILQNDSVSVYEVIFKDENTDENIESKIRLESFLIYDTTISNRRSSFVLNVLEKNSGVSIKGKIETYRIRSKDRETLWKLRDLAVEESEKNDSFYQIIFVDTLMNMGLSCNAAYYKYLFNLTTKNQQLKEYLKNK